MTIISSCFARQGGATDIAYPVRSITPTFSAGVLEVSCRFLTGHTEASSASTRYHLHHSCYNSEPADDPPSLPTHQATYIYPLGQTRPRHGSDACFKQSLDKTKRDILKRISVLNTLRIKGPLYNRPSTIPRKQRLEKPKNAISPTHSRNFKLQYLATGS